MTPPPKDSRDWDKELARVDQAMARQAQGPAPASRPGQPAVTPGTPSRASSQQSVYTWVRLSLALILGVGMTQWPYLHGCGLPLVAYLLGTLTVMVASVWSMLSSWRSRSRVPHVLSIVLLFWGTALAAREILPRIGYARVTATWLCAQPGQPGTAAPAPAPAPAAPPTTEPAAPSTTQPGAGAPAPTNPGTTPVAPPAQAP